MCDCVQSAIAVARRRVLHHGAHARDSAVVDGTISQVTTTLAAAQHLRDLARLRSVGCSSLGTFSTRFTEVVGVPPSTYRRQSARTAAELPSCVTKQVRRPNQELRHAGRNAAATVNAMALAAAPNDRPQPG